MRRAIAAWYPWVTGLTGLALLAIRLVIDLDAAVALIHVEYLALLIMVVVLEQNKASMRTGIAGGFGTVAVVAAVMMGGETAAQLMSLGILVNTSGNRKRAIAVFDAGSYVLAASAGSMVASWTGHPVNGPFAGTNMTGPMLFAGAHFVTVTILRDVLFLLQGTSDKYMEHLRDFGMSVVLATVSMSLGISVVLAQRMLGASTFYFMCLTLSMLAFLINMGTRLMSNREGLFGLYQAASSINEALTLGEVFERAHSFTRAQIKHDFAWLALPAGDEGDGLTIAYSSHGNGIDLEQASAHVMSVRSASGAKSLGDQYVWNRDGRSPKPGYFAWVAITPLHLGKQYLGDFGVASLSTPQEMAPEKLQLLAVLSSHLALAVDNALKFERATMLAFTDPLTGLYNYRQFQNLFREALARAEKSDTQVSLIYVDLDYFRDVNNTYGHQVGDEALKGIAKTIRASCRDKDLVCRPGGDEFTVILPGVPKDKARVVAGRIKENLAAVRLDVGLDQPLVSAVGASVGVSAYPEDGSDVDGLVRKADADMYASKVEAGRV